MSLNDRTAQVLSRIPSVFQRLMISYIVLVFLVAVSVSGVSYLYFKSVYERELDDFHALYLKNIEKELSNQVVDSSKQIYMEISTLLSQRSGDLLAPEGEALEASKIYNSYLILNDIVARHYDKLESIQLYYVRSGLLMSSSGFHADPAGLPDGNGSLWLSELRERKARSSWSFYRRPAYLGIPSIELFRSVRCFPILSDPESCSVLVCLDFRADYLAQAMARLSPEDGGRTALMSASSLESILSWRGAKWDAETEARLRGSIGEGKQGLASLTAKADGRPSLFTVIPLSDSGWELVNVVQLKALYKRSGYLRFVILAICLATIGLGALVASFVASGLYNPLERLMAKFRSLFGLPPSSGGADEYSVIDEAISGISTRMDGLIATVEANGPIIAHELVMRLVEGERVEAAEVRDTFELLGAGPLPGELCAVVLSVEGGDEARGEGGRVLKYRVADELAREGQDCLLATALAGERVGLVAERARAEEWNGLVASRTGALSRAAIGPVVASPGELGDSFAVAVALAKYFFLFPDRNLLTASEYLLSRSGRSAMPHKDFPKDLGLRLRERDIAGFRALLATYVAQARGGECQIRSIRSELESFCLMVSDFAREIGLSSASSLEKSLPELLAESRSIEAFIAELSSAAADVCSSSEDPQRKRNALLVSKIKAYAAANLSGDLSLDRVGEAVAVSPGYMGKIFKEETGRNYVSYITELRLAEAARLLVQSRESVQEIGRCVGMHSPAYFIRLFRGRYGQTPLEYRRSRSVEEGD
jgi:Response regulator containing CheY-like receiver domain and AraC-type DNA-binding domain